MNTAEASYSSATVKASFQGNVLTSDAVVNRMRESFLATEGQWIGDRVVAAMQNVAQDGVSGDARCRNPGWFSDTSVAGADQAALLISCSCGNGQDISIGLSDTRGRDAASELRIQYDAVASNLRCTPAPTPRDFTVGSAVSRGLEKIH